jgi:hypothetical protein
MLLGRLTTTALSNNITACWLFENSSADKQQGNAIMCCAGSSGFVGVMMLFGHSHACRQQEFDMMCFARPCSCCWTWSVAGLYAVQMLHWQAFRLLLLLHMLCQS